MKSRALLILTVLFGLSVVVTGQGEERRQVLSKYRVEKIESSQMLKIADAFEVVKKLENGYEVIVDSSKKAQFLALAPNAELVQKDISEDLSQLQFFNAGPNKYRNFEEVQNLLKTWVAAHPNIAQVIEYGKSKEGRPLVALKISDRVDQDETEPELMLTAATHGDELITTEILLNLMERLLTSYGTDARLTKMVEEHELFFIPVVNADGFASRQRYDGFQDPNRTYPYPGFPVANSTPSIAAIIQFFHSRDFKGSIDFHAHGELVMYPWAYTAESIPQPDRANFDALAKYMSEVNGYTYGPINEVIYVAKGSSADYYYWQKKSISFGIEVGTSKVPNVNQIPRYTEEQAELLWRFIENF